VVVQMVGECVVHLGPIAVTLEMRIAVQVRIGCWQFPFWNVAVYFVNLRER
jgi:hypothetical protein